MLKSKSNLRIIICFTALIVLFQNCTGGFSVFFNSESSSVSESENQPSSSAGPKVIYEAKIQELQAVWVTIEGTGKLSFPAGLPKGALFDEGIRQLKWIPARGQSGAYSIQVHENGIEKGIVSLNVGAVSEPQLRNGGPPYLYRDGDVGYIFVHGAGDIDRCAQRDDLVRYWGVGPEVVAPDAKNRLVVCYDSRAAVANVARGVANQILAANCGRFNRCVIFTHSMGGLLMEHMFLHTRPAQATDPEPQMFANRELYQAVKERTLFVVSLASAAGGSKAASIVNSDGRRQLGEEAIGAITRVIGMNDDATRNLVVSYASRVVAPFREDPGVPFFMVPGFSEKTAAEASGVLGSLFDLSFNQVPLIVFNGDRSLAMLDSLSQFQSRSDGLVDFRSACGVASDSENEGPGRSASLEEHFRYCWNAPKKPNHYVWFLTSMNHYVITGQPFNCKDSNVPCVALFPNENEKSFAMRRDFTGLTAMEVVRKRLADPVTAPAPVLRALASVE